MKPILRPAKKEDWEELLKINKQHDFPFPNFKNMLAVYVVEEDGKIIGWGYLKQFVESVFVPSKDSKQGIVKSLKLLTEESKRQAELNGIEQINCFVDAQFKEILTKHFGYGESTGFALYLNVGNNGETGPEGRSE